MGVVYLVADAPHYNRRVVAVAAHPTRDILLKPVIEKSRVVKFGLGTLPHIEGLAVNEYSQLVTQLHESSSGHIMRCPYRVYTHFLHFKQAALFGRAVERRAEAAEIVVQTNAVQLDASAVQQKSFVGVERSFAEPHTLSYAVELGPVFREDRAEREQVRVLYVPDVAF